LHKNKIHNLQKPHCTIKPGREDTEVKDIGCLETLELNSIPKAKSISVFETLMRVLEFKS
jgi:hypothetical protein